MQKILFMNKGKNKIPVWFWIVSTVAILWNIMGVASFFMQIMISDETLQALPINERELYGNYPLWTKIAFALAVFGGLFGSIALLLRKKYAKPLFLISLVAIIIQMYHHLFMINSIEVYGTEAWIMPILVFIIGILLVWFSWFCYKKNWIK